MDSAAELHERGLTALNKRRYDQAERTLALAAMEAEKSGDQLRRARIATTQAYLVYETGDPDGALSRITELLGERWLTEEAEGVIHCQHAMLLLRRGHTADALAAFDRGIGRLNGPVDLATALVNRGGVYLAQLRPREAAQDFEQALGLWPEGHEDQRAMTLHNLGYAQYVAGDLIAALGSMDQAAPRMREMSPAMAATVDQDRAEVLVAAGLRVQGQQSLSAAAAAFGELGLTQRQAEAELALASHLTVTDPDEADRVARSALDGFEEVRASGLALRARAVAFEAAVTAGANPSDDGEALAGPLEEQGLSWPALRVRIQARLARIRSAESAGLPTRPASGRVIGPVPPEAPIDIRLLERELRAELAVAAGRALAGLRELRAGLDDFHLWQSSFGSLDLQTNVAGHGRILARRGLELAVDSGEADVLFEWSERARMLASRVQSVRPPSDPALAEMLTELRGGVGPERETQLRQEIRERAWQVKGSGQVADPILLGDLQERLDKSALVAYVVAGERVVALVVTADSVNRVDLGDSGTLRSTLGGLLPDLDVAATDLPGPLGAAVRGDLVDRLAQLSKILVVPLLDYIGDRPIVLTPSAVLAPVPWTLLTGLVGRSVTVAQSATTWLARSATPIRLDSAGFVAGPRVMRASDEVAAGAASWPGARCLTGEEASAEAVASLAQEVDVLHIAAHGRHSAENPLFSGVELADGAWHGYDIDLLATVPDVVLLSACEVGRSNVRWGEELIGLVGAWLHAGTRVVIASPAVVADEVAHKVFLDLHAGLAKGLAPAEALAGAIRPADTDSAPAPFVCFS